MKAALGQPIIVENVTGAGGTIGIMRVVRADPDGYTVSIGHLNSHVFSGATYNLSFDLLGDLAPVALLTTSPELLTGRGGLPPNNYQELVAWLRANPSASFGSVGMGGQGASGALISRQRGRSAAVRAVPRRGCIRAGPGRQPIDLAAPEG
jgi:tripartite-type tricarboxylate transporter receptor subunit TctC